MVQVSESLWACCGLTDDGRDCENPSNETFGLAASSKLSSYFSIPATGYSYTSVSASSSATSASISTSTASIASVSTAAPTASDTGTSEGIESHKSGLSTGSIAGIVIGIGAAIILGAVVWFLLRRRRTRPKVQRQELDSRVKSEASRPDHPEMAEQTVNMAFYRTNDEQRRLELPADREPGELVG